MKIEPVVREALDLVQASGKLDGNEHLAIVRGDKIVRTVNGTPDSVQLHDVLEAGDIEPGDIIVHNLPTSYNSLSNMDLMLARKVEARWIYAISQDGSVYRGRITNVPGPAMFQLMFSMAGESLLDRAEQVGVADTFKAYGGGRFGPAHWINRMMAHDGMIDYEYELADESARLIKAIDEAIISGRRIESKAESSEASPGGEGIAKGGRG